MLVYREDKRHVNFSISLHYKLQAELRFCILMNGISRRRREGCLVLIDVLKAFEEHLAAT